jgi:hypothetical protein
MWLRRLIARCLQLFQSESYEAEPNATFGACEHNGIDALDCSISVATPHSPETKFASHIWLYEDQPTRLQRQLFIELRNHYDEFWPTIAQELLRLHPDLSTTEDVTTFVKNRVGVHIGEHAEDSLELLYEFNLPNEGFRGFFLRVQNAAIVQSFVAE